MASACRESSSALKGFPRKDTNMFVRGNTCTRRSRACRVSPLRPLHAQHLHRRAPEHPAVPLPTLPVAAELPSFG
jgi:hypothetical protein